jgi:DNA polymerase
VEHPTFVPILLAYDLTPQYGGATAAQWEFCEPFDKLAPLFAHIRAGRLLEAHNAGFEYQVWNYWCVPVLGWPPLAIEQLRCSAVKARAAGYPGSLDPLTRVLDTPVKKDPDGTRLMKLFSIPRNPTKKDPRVITPPRDAPEEWARYKSYNLTDIVAEHQVSERVPDLNASEQELWFLDQEINDRGHAVDTTGIRDCKAIVEQAYAVYGAEFRALTGGIEPTELQQMKDWLHSRGVHLNDATEKSIDETVQQLEAAGRLAAEVAGRAFMVDPSLRALQIRQALGSASVKKLYALDAQTASDGRVHDMYQMHATHHGRTGGYGPQPANLYKGEWHTPEEVDAALAVIATRSLAAVEAAYPKIGALEVVNNCLRSLFIAGPGKVLVSSDYAAIEGVVLAALAGEQWIIDVFNTHGMLYEAQISRMTGVPFEEFVRHKRETGKHHPLRQQGKLAVLSGGYASWINGWKKFGADKYYNSDAEIKAAILAYRDSVPNIVEFWGGQTRDKFQRSERPELYGLEGAAISAVQNPGQCYRVGLIGFQMSGDCLYMGLPSGRFIAYHQPRLRQATRPYASAWELALSYWGWNSNPDKGPPDWIQMDLYGGVLTQNATGGVARDVMQHGLLNLKREGYPTVMQTYDEAVAEVDANDASKTVEGLEACLNDLPAYARGWPIRAKGGWRGPRYGKWD